jgi:hypothetical protein
MAAREKVESLAETSRRAASKNLSNHNRGGCEINGPTTRGGGATEVVDSFIGWLLSLVDSFIGWLLSLT